MADETPGEVGEAVQELEDDVPNVEEQVVFGEAEEKTSTTGSLVSDFCKAEEENAEEEEEAGEGYWVCRGEEKEDLGEGWQYSQGEEEGEDMEDLTTEEKRSLDSQYLKTVLGAPLTFALMDIAMKRPTDPIQFLGSYLLKWRWANTSTIDYKKQIQELNEEREAYRERMREEERQIMLENEEREEDLRRAEREESTVEDEDFGEGQELGIEGE